MGVFSKLKGIFYDEVVEDDEEVEEKEIKKVDKLLKREPKKEIDDTPKIEEIKYKTVDIEPIKEETPKTESTFSERDLFRSERTFKFVDFADEEEEKPISKRNVLSEQNKNSYLEPTPQVSEQPKVFKPSPVISPVWGVLDKDYKKDEIKTKSVQSENLSSAVTSYDTVRRKAYGTLEDELEDTLNSINKISTETINKEINKVDKDVELLEQKTAKIENLISQIEEATEDIDREMTIGDLEEKVEIDNFEETKPEINETISDSTLEHDLFNLIDSMYDKED